MPDPDLPTPPSQPEPVPSWLRPPPPAAPGARWLAAARRWLQPVAGGDEPPSAAEPAAEPMSDRLRRAAAARAELPALPPALMDRLRRCVTHAVRHPGFGFALLRLQLELPSSSTIHLAAGSAVGRQAVRRLLQAMRPGDALALLPGPASFAMVLDGVNQESDLRTIVGRLLAELNEPFIDGYEPVAPKPRLGAVFCPPGQSSRPAEALLQLAERALKDATPGDWALAGTGALRPDAQRLQRALGSDGLVAGFEPQVELAAAGVSALGVQLALRDAGARPIELADIGDNDALAELWLQRSLALGTSPFLAWRQADSSRQACRLALAVPACLVRRAGWADELGQLLQDAGLAGADLQLEMPPTLALQDPNLPARLQELARLGVALALDDFGTGRSSLSALARLPLSLIKIDRGFVPQAHELEHHRVLLESTVRLAGQLGIGTLGKGLETSAQLALLRGLGCQRGEGAAAAALLPPRALHGLPRLPLVA